MKHIGLFDGIGGFSLAARWMGWKTVSTCEINPFGQRVLQYYFPEAYHHGDIHTLTYELINAELKAKLGKMWRNEDIILTGGFPCQPYSVAGKRKGKEDERHLFPEMLRVIKEVRPRWVVGENVHGIVSWNGGLVFHEVQFDLEEAGYEVFPFVLPACGINAPHKRERVWFVAYDAEAKVPVEAKKLNNALEHQGFITDIPDWNNFPAQSPVCNKDTERGKPYDQNGVIELDGISFSNWRKESIKAYGNAIVPQVAREIYKAIELYGTSIL